MPDYQIGDTVTLTEKSTGSVLVREVVELPFSGPGVQVVPGDVPTSIIKILSGGGWALTSITPKVQAAPKEDGFYVSTDQNSFYLKDGAVWSAFGFNDEFAPIWVTIDKAELDEALHAGITRYVPAPAIALADVPDEVKAEVIAERNEELVRKASE